MDEINVVYAADDNYACLAGVSMLSLFENNKHCNKLHVYILSNSISEANKERLYKIGRHYKKEVSLIDVAYALENLMKSGINGYSNAQGNEYTPYVRLLIPDLIPNGKRIIYLDCDTLVIGDVMGLWQTDMRGKPIGLAYDCIHSRYKRFISLGSKDSYYNTGVMLMDLDGWTQKKCMERILYHIANVRSEYPLVDQDFINVVLQKDIYQLDMKYNYLSQYFLYSYYGIKKVYGLQESCFYGKMDMQRPKEAVILHFCGQTFLRPWYSNSRHPAKKLYDSYYAISPWKREKQKKCKWKLPYKIQYLLWRYAPGILAEYVGGGNAKILYENIL